MIVSTDYTNSIVSLSGGDRGIKIFKPVLYLDFNAENCETREALIGMFYFTKSTSKLVAAVTFESFSAIYLIISSRSAFALSVTLTL